MNKILSAAVVSFVLASGVAFAQDAGNTTNATDAAKNEMLKPFYTDDSMGTMRGAEELKSIWQAMAPEKQKAMTDECAKPGASQRLSDVCSAVNPS